VLKDPSQNAAGMYKLLGDIMDNLVVNRERALAEVNEHGSIVV